MLHAILDKEPQNTMECFETWSASICFDEIEAGSFRLIPALYKKMSSLNDDFPNKSRMQGIYRYFLYKNSLLMHKSLEVLDIFDEARIDYILLKGAALVSAYYEEPALRPMNDIDILVEEFGAEIPMSFMEQLNGIPDRKAEKKLYLT